MDSGATAQAFCCQTFTSKQALKKAFQRAALLCHPDKVGSDATADFQKLRQAFDLGKIKFAQGCSEFNFSTRDREEVAFVRFTSSYEGISVADLAKFMGLWIKACRVGKPYREQVRGHSCVTLTFTHPKFALFDYLSRWWCHCRTKPPRGWDAEVEAKWIERYNMNVLIFRHYFRWVTNGFVTKVAFHNWLTFFAEMAQERYDITKIPAFGDLEPNPPREDVKSMECYTHPRAILKFLNCTDPDAASNMTKGIPPVRQRTKEEVDKAVAEIIGPAIEAIQARNAGKMTAAATEEIIDQMMATLPQPILRDTAGPAAPVPATAADSITPDEPAIPIADPAATTDVDATDSADAPTRTDSVEILGIKINRFCRDS